MRQHIVPCVGCVLFAEVDRLAMLLSVRCVLYKAHIARYAATSQSTNEVFLLIKLSVALVRNNVCSLMMVELLKHVGANKYFNILS
jgi:hypothetical protein